MEKARWGQRTHRAFSDPGEGCAVDVDGGLNAGEEDGVVDGVTKVKEDKDVEGVIIWGEEEVVCDLD